MRAKLLLDENMSVWATQRLCAEDGIDACHVRDRGMLGVEDHVVLDKAFQEDRILVTANVDDFVQLARKRELHAGIVLIEDASLHRDEQLTIIRAVVAFTEGEDMANRVLWIGVDGHMRFEDVPPE